MVGPFEILHRRDNEIAASMHFSQPQPLRHSGEYAIPMPVIT
jgi:hypothetical protein